MIFLSPLFSPVYLHHFTISYFRKVQDQRAWGNHWWDIKVKASWSTRAQRGNKRQTKQNVLANVWKPVYWFQLCASPQISSYSTLASPPNISLSSCVTSAFSFLKPDMDSDWPGGVDSIPQGFVYRLKICLIVSVGGNLGKGFMVWVSCFL